MKNFWLILLAIVSVNTEVTLAQSCKDSFHNNLVIPKASQWKILTDLTERGGSSQLRLEDVSEGLQLQGSVGAIAGRTGPVGFVIARIPYQIKDGSIGGLLALTSNKDINLTLTLTMESDSTLSYQNTIPIKAGSQEISFMWNDFKPFFRGQPQPEALPIDLNLVDSFALQVTRGNQVPEIRNNLIPIEFTFVILN